jgi:hypothetical protein
MSSRCSLYGQLACIRREARHLARHAAPLTGEGCCRMRHAAVRQSLSTPQYHCALHDATCTLSLEAVAREYAARRMVELSTYLTPARVRTEIPVGPGRAGGRDGFRGRRNRRHLPPWYGSRTRIDLCAC